jgi:hypothetical protein
MSRRSHQMSLRFFLRDSAYVVASCDTAPVEGKDAPVKYCVGLLGERGKSKGYTGVGAGIRWWVGWALSTIAVVV